MTPSVAWSTILSGVEVHESPPPAATAAGIVPRWEWRTFGARFGEAEAAFAARTPERVQESDELYLLSVGGGDTVKVRDDLMDVKHLELVDDNGLEQWLPVLKAEFPLPARTVESVLASLRIAPGPLARGEYTLVELLEEVVTPKPALRAVEVHKRRARYTIGGCMTELTDVQAEGASTRTIAVETEDAGRVLATVQQLGLAGRANVSFPRGLRKLLGFGVGRYAVVDVGTNSVKFHVGERDVDGAWATIADRAEVTRLGEGLAETGRLQPEPIARTADAIAGMAAEAERDGVLATAAVGTAALRIAPNASDLIEEVRSRCGLVVEVLPGDEEARLAYLAATSALPVGDGSLVVFDTGGGSSQFTFGRRDRVDERFSVDVGAARYTDQFGLARAVGEDVVRAAQGAIASDLSRLEGKPRPDAVVGLGGANTNLAAVKHGLASYDPEVVQGTVLDLAEIDRQIELYRTTEGEARRAIVGLQPNRADVILAGACVVRTVLTQLGVESLTVSDRGLRHGLLAERFG
jgi:exopolyphosphatase/guanosine-5'-triphosphate,3'-diphosphate pyrophosphatase